MSRRWRWSFAGVLLAVALVLPLLMPSDYYTHLLVLISMNSVLAMTFIVMLRAGLLNMSTAAFWGIGAYSAAMLTLKVGWSFWVALPASIAIAVCIGLAFGAIVVRYSGLGFIMPTLIFAFMVPLVFGTFKVFGGYVGLIRIPPPGSIPLPGGAEVTFGSVRSYYYLVLVFAVVSIAVMLAFYRAWTGRAWRALGLSKNLAQSVGINPFRYRLLGFVIVSALAALMGVFFAVYSTNIQPGSYGPFKVIYVQMYAILGGVGTPILGPIIGAGILTIVPEALRFTGGFEPMITGALIILILIFIPQGITGLFQRRKSSEAIRMFRRAIGWIARGQQQAAPLDGSGTGPVPETPIDSDQVSEP